MLVTITAMASALLDKAPRPADRPRAASGL
jgi:hypothetical protein